MLLPALLKEGFEPSSNLKLFIDAEDINAKFEWEEAYQAEIALLASELENLRKMEPQLTYSREDASRSWHGLDGQPMPLWTPPIPLSNASETKFRVEDHLSYLYQINLMEENDLPPVYVKKELLKRTANANEPVNDLEKHKIRKSEDGLFPSNQGGGTYAPRSLFDRHPAFQKQKFKAQAKRMPLGSGSYVHGPLPPNFSSQTGSNAVSGLRHPIPRQQVEAENQPEWLIQEDWALLKTIKEVQGMPLTLNTLSPAHTVNWDLVSDMVNAVSRVYRGPRQCRIRFETIISPREEGRILYDMPPSSALTSGTGANAAAAANKKNKKNKPGNLKLPNSSGSTKMNKPMKTSQIFNLDKNNSWSSLFSNRFETIKAVANKRSPTTKPLVVNPSQKNTKHAAVLSDAGIIYDTPLNPEKVAANRAERIQKEKQKTAQDQAAQLTQQRVAAAQAAANAAQQSAAQTARVAIVQQQQQANQSAVVVGIPASSQQTAVRQVISQQELLRSQQQLQQATVVASAAAAQQQPTVVVTSQTPVVSVGSLTASQLAQTLVKQANKPMGGSPVTSTGIPSSRLTPQQINILKQQALQKRNAVNKAAGLQGIPTVSAASVVAATSGQKVSIAVTPTGVTLATIANSMPVTVVTQSLGHQKTQLIRGIPGSKGNLRMSEADMKLLLANKSQLQQQKVVGSVNQQQTVTQLLQGIQGGQQVTTLVKGQASGSGTSGVPSSQSVTIPVQMQSVQGIKTLRQNQQPTMVQLRHQLVQGARGSNIISQGGTKTILATSQQGQKVALSQVAAGAKGVPAQLIVSSGNSTKPVTVQQIHQIKGQPGQGQQLIPHNIIKAGQGQGSTVQARVIPATVAGRPQQIHVVAAPASATVSNAQAVNRQNSGAPNVTVDASGRPTAGTPTLTAGSQIRVAAGTPQLLNQVLGVRTTPTSVISQGTPNATKLQVVHAPSVQQQQQQQQNDQQQNG